MYRRKRLKETAIPVERLPATAPIEDLRYKDSGFDARTRKKTYKKKTYKMKILSITKKSKMEEDDKMKECSDITHQQFLEGCDKFLSPHLSEIVKARSYPRKKGLKTAVLDVVSCSWVWDWE
jgi:hypothetical protein